MKILRASHATPCQSMDLRNGKTVASAVCTSRLLARVGRYLIKPARIVAPSAPGWVVSQFDCGGISGSFSNSAWTASE